MALCLSFAGCKQTQGQGETAESEGGNTNLKIAYVELDTLMSQYQLYKDYSEVLTVKGNNIQNTLSKKQQRIHHSRRTGTRPKQHPARGSRAAGISCTPEQ